MDYNFIETGVISKNPVLFRNSRGYEFSILGFRYMYEGSPSYISVLKWGRCESAVGDKVIVSGEIRESGFYPVFRVFCEELGVKPIASQ